MLSSHVLIYYEHNKVKHKNQIMHFLFQSINVEGESKEQHQSKLWFEHRAGRVTASNFKAASRTNPQKPSATLIRRICYPDAYKCSTTSTRYLRALLSQQQGHIIQSLITL